MMTHSPALLSNNLDRWLAASWQTDCRYYQADISCDLFGMWILKRCWGGLHSKRGNSKTLAFNRYEDALSSFDEIAKRRQQRGYSRIA